MVVVVEAAVEVGVDIASGVSILAVAEMLRDDRGSRVAVTPL